MSYVKNWLHCAWSTKNQIQFFSPGKKSAIISHIRTNAGTKGIYIDSLNGSSDHLHCILLLNGDQTLSKVMQIIMYESSYWINKNLVTREKFEWSDEYYGLSISESHRAKFTYYLNMQEEYHKTKTWVEECEELCAMYGYLKV